MNRGIVLLRTMKTMTLGSVIALGIILPLERWNDKLHLSFHTLERKMDTIIAEQIKINNRNDELIYNKKQN